MKKFIFSLMVIPVILFSTLSSVVVMKGSYSILTNPDTTEGVPPELESESILDVVEFVLIWIVLIIAILFFSLIPLGIIWFITYLITGSFFWFVFNRSMI